MTSKARIDSRGMQMESDISKALASTRLILNCTDEQFASRAFILDRVRQYGLAFTGWPLFSRYSDWQNISEFGLLQLPTEFCDFAMELTRLEINSAIEIGVFRGASSFFICAMLQRANSDISYKMVDTEDNIVAFDEFAKLLNLQKHVPACSDDFSAQSFDFVFIDADHSYHGVLRDYINVGKFSRKAVAFHDICAHEYDPLDGGTVRFWREFRDSNAYKMRILQFSHSPIPWMGLGLGVHV